MGGASLPVLRFVRGGPGVVINVHSFFKSKSLSNGTFVHHIKRHIQSPSSQR